MILGWSEGNAAANEIAGFPSGSFTQTLFKRVDVATEQKHRLLSAITTWMPKGQVVGYVSNFTEYLQAVIPERFEGELSWKVQKFFDPSNNTTLQHTFEIVAFLCSNNLLNHMQKRNFV